MSATDPIIESRLDPDAKIAVATYADQYTTDLLVLAYERSARQGNLIIRRDDIIAARRELRSPGRRPSLFKRFAILFLGGLGAALLEIGLDQALDERTVNSVLFLGLLLVGWAVWQQVTLFDS